MYKKKDNVDGESVNLHIYDTGCPTESSEEVWKHYQQHIMWADVLVIIFSVDNAQSFKVYHIYYGQFVTLIL